MLDCLILLDVIELAVPVPYFVIVLATIALLFGSLLFCNHVEQHSGQKIALAGGSLNCVISSFVHRDILVLVVIGACRSLLSSGGDMHQAMQQVILQKVDAPLFSPGANYAVH